MAPGKLLSDPLNALSLGIALMFGTAGFPHILMRFFTVPSAKEARKSVFVATSFIGYFYLLTFVIGFSAIALLAQHPEFFKTAADGHFNLTHDLLGGSNMVAVKLAQALGGNLFYGFIAAVTFATILAVVAGLTLSGATTVSHDLYACWLARGKGDDASEMRVSRVATVILSMVAMGLGVLFEHVNVAFLVGLVAAVAASANFPILVSSIFWRGMTTRGAVVGGSLGLISAVLLTLFSKAVWVDVLHQTHALVTLDFIGRYDVGLRCPEVVHEDGIDTDQDPQGAEGNQKVVHDVLTRNSRLLHPTAVSVQPRPAIHSRSGRSGAGRASSESAIRTRHQRESPTHRPPST